MSANGEWLRVFLATNVLLALSYTLLGIARRGTVASRFRHADWLMLAKVLLVASLLLPAAIALSPSGWLRSVGWLSPPRQSVTRFLSPDAADSGVRGPGGSGTLAARTLPAPSPAEKPALSFDWRFILLLASLAMGGRLLISLTRLVRLLGRAAPLRRIGRVAVLVSDEVTIPFATLVGRGAWVVLPIGLLASRRDTVIAIRHELQHHRQGDTRWVLFLELLKIACCANPAAFLWGRRFAELQELACDEALVAGRRVSRHDYGHCLLRVAEATLERHPALLATAGMSNTRSLGKSFLTRRIHMLTSYASLAPRKHFTWLAASTVAVFLLVAAGASATLVSGRESESVKPGLPAVNPVVQGIAERALRDGLETAKADAGLAIVADPDTGLVLAVAHHQRIPGAAVPQSIGAYLATPMKPWSVMKPLVAAVAIEKGKTRIDEPHDCERGVYRVGAREYSDYKPFDKLTTADTIVQSSTICGIKIAQKLDGGKLVEGIAQLGFGPTNVAFDYPGAAHGVLPTEEGQEPMQLSPSLSFGYGIKATPLEIVQAYGAIANGGKLLQPQEYKSVASPQVVRQVFSAETASAIRGALRRVVTEGTGTAAAAAHYTTAGKTGTGSARSTPFKASDTASFMGFAPATNPRVTIYVLVLSPRESGAPHGGRHAGPIFGRIAEETLTALNVTPDRP